MSVALGIRVQVRSVYVPERSRPEAGAYFFAYTVVITNEGDRTWQLRSRWWRIRDGEGRIEEVKGPGVVGEMPTLPPGQSFQYQVHISNGGPSVSSSIPRGSHSRGSKG